MPSAARLLFPIPVPLLLGSVCSTRSPFLARELPTFWLVGHYMLAAGIVTALVAAIPGIIDYATTVPPRCPRRSARRRAG